MLPRAGAFTLAFLVLQTLRGAFATQVKLVDRSRSRSVDDSFSHSFVHERKSKHLLRVCNAYPYKIAMDVFRGKEELTGSAPLLYKTCRDFRTQLEDGDKLDFKIGDSRAGSFQVTEMPATDAMLLLVIHRHDTVTTSVAFESHVFASLTNSQVAVIDTYKGSTKSTPKIMDAPLGTAKDGEETRVETLRFGTVVAVKPGKYKVTLVNKEDKDILSEGSLVTSAHENYVVLRVGVDASEGPSYPEEIIVFPPPEGTGLHGSAARPSALSRTLASCLALLLAVFSSSLHTTSLW